MLEKYDVSKEGIGKDRLIYWKVDYEVSAFRCKNLKKIKVFAMLLLKGGVPNDWYAQTQKKMLAFQDTEPVKVITGACVKIGLNQEKPYK